jgi:hypothetical protein
MSFHTIRCFSVEAMKKHRVRRYSISVVLPTCSGHRWLDIANLGLLEFLIIEKLPVVAVSFQEAVQYGTGTVPVSP